MSSNYALTIRNALGVIVFDSREATGGVPVGSYELAPGASQTVHLTAYAGKKVRPHVYGFPVVSVSYASGHPVVTMTYGAGFVVNSLVWLFAY